MKWSYLFCSLVNLYTKSRDFFLYMRELLVKGFGAGCTQIGPSFPVLLVVVIPGHPETFPLTGKQSSRSERTRFHVFWAVQLPLLKERL